MRTTRLLLVIALLPAVALPQTLPNMASTRLAYTVRKRTVNPTGELKEKIDANDKEMAEAARLGKNGEVRRLVAKGMTLLAGNEWTETLDFSNSIVLRSERTIVDSSNPYAVRLEQIYTPSTALDRSLAARVSLRKPGQQQQVGEVVKDLGSFDEISRDLRESPYLMELDLSGVADGAYVVRADVLDGDKPLGSVSLRIFAQKGLDPSVSRLEAAAAQAPEAIRADILYPVDFMRNVNRGRVDRGAFDVAKEIAGAEQLLAAAKSGKDPFAGRTGDIKRHYFFKAAGEIMPYRTYIPTSYNGSKAFPMVLALHGLGGTEDSMFGGLYNIIEQAEKRGYLVVSPMGYRVDGGYGSGVGSAGRRTQLSEQDVMEVFERFRKEYKVDDKRIYLMGHSMGGFGTWALGAKYPQYWAALGPISGGGNPATIERMKSIPEVVVHGDADNVVPVASSRVMVAEMKKLGVDVKYIEQPGGTHMNIAAPNMAAMFDFFDAHKKN